MKSPFPGMDPYLERHWRDVHASLIIYARDRLQEQLPAGLKCRVEERVVLELPEGTERSMYPDIRVMEKRHGNGTPHAATDTAIAVDEPLVLYVPEEAITETFIEIIDAATGHKVITVVEVLSPTNKLPGTGQDQYLKKKRELHQAGVSLVEIDLLRQGQRFYPVPILSLPASHRTHYQIVVKRGWQPDRVEFYRASLRERLPTIKVPLLAEIPDVLLELQPLIEKCYRNGRYEDINYKEPPDPPLDGSDVAWAQDLLTQAGR
jgi:hypothetical protein